MKTSKALILLLLAFLVLLGISWGFTKTIGVEYAQITGQAIFMFYLLVRFCLWFYNKGGKATK